MSTFDDWKEMAVHVATALNGNALSENVLSATSTLARVGVLDDLARSFEETIGRSPNELDQMDIIRHGHFSGRWLGCGMATFQLTHSALAAFALTDPSSVIESVKLPFDAFVIILPQPFWTLRGRNGSPDIAVDAITFHKYEGRDGHTATWIKVSGAEGGSGTEEQLQLVRKLAVQDPQWLLDSPRDESTVEEDSEILRLVKRVVINMCLWIAANGSGERIGKRGSDSRLQGPVPTMWMVGRAIKLDKRVIDRAKGRLGTEWKLRGRFVVRGHWRQQACGPAHSEHKLIWIEPYWKGPQDGVGIMRAYDIDKENDNG